MLGIDHNHAKSFTSARRFWTAAQACKVDLLTISMKIWCRCSKTAMGLAYRGLRLLQTHAEVHSLIHTHVRTYEGCVARVSCVRLGRKRGGREGDPSRWINAVILFRSILSEEGRTRPSIQTLGNQCDPEVKEEYQSIRRRGLVAHYTASSSSSYRCFCVTLTSLLFCS